MLKSKQYKFARCVFVYTNFSSLISKTILPFCKRVKKLRDLFFYCECD